MWKCIRNKLLIVFLGSKSHEKKRMLCSFWWKQSNMIDLNHAERVTWLVFRLSFEFMKHDGDKLHSDAKIPNFSLLREKPNRSTSFAAKYFCFMHFLMLLKILIEWCHWFGLSFFGSSDNAWSTMAIGIPDLRHQLLLLRIIPWFICKYYWEKMGMNGQPQKPWKNWFEWYHWLFDPPHYYSQDTKWSNPKISASNPKNRYLEERKVTILLHGFDTKQQTTYFWKIFMFLMKWCY